MEITRSEIIAQLSKTHDQIKEHPFRFNFDQQYIADYKHLLYHLTELWCDIIYRCNFESEQEKMLYRQFGGWIHDFRQELQTYHKDTFPMRYFDYYERMLQVTHIFIETGNMDVFYNIDVFFPDADDYKKRIFKVEKYQLITKELCGIDSSILPRYFPVDTTMETDDETVWECLDKDCYPYYRWDEERKRKFFEEWKRDIKPVLEWINAQHPKTEYKHRTWRSLKYS